MYKSDVAIYDHNINKTRLFLFVTGIIPLLITPLVNVYVAFLFGLDMVVKQFNSMIGEKHG